MDRNTSRSTSRRTAPPPGASDCVVLWGDDEPETGDADDDQKGERPRESRSLPGPGLPRSSRREPSRGEVAALRAITIHGTIPAAAASLGLSRHTVDGRLDSLRRKTGLRYLPQLIALAAHRGWLGSFSY